MPLPGKQVVTTCRDKGRVRQKSWKKMIAVSQNMMLGSLVAPLGAAAPLTDGAATDGNAFLQSFIMDDAASVIVDEKSPSRDAKQAIEGKAPDTFDEDESIEITLPDGAIWQPVAQTIAILPMPVSGEAILTKDTATDGPSAQLSDDQLVQGAKGQADPIGETSPISLAVAAFTADKSVAPLIWSTVATDGHAEIDTPKQNAENAPTFQSGTAPKLPEPLQSAHPKAINLGEDLNPQRDAATKRPGQPHDLDTPFAEAAEVATTPSERPKQSYFDHDATITIGEVAVGNRSMVLVFPPQRLPGGRNGWAISRYRPGMTRQILIKPACPSKPILHPQPGPLLRRLYVWLRQGKKWQGQTAATLP